MAGRGDAYAGKGAAADNRANQLNPTHTAYQASRSGSDSEEDDWDDSAGPSTSEAWADHVHEGELLSKGPRVELTEEQRIRNELQCCLERRDMQALSPSEETRLGAEIGALTRQLAKLRAAN
jgi:hypothetical protein